MLCHCTGRLNLKKLFPSSQKRTSYHTLQSSSLGPYRYVCAVTSSSEKWSSIDAIRIGQPIAVKRCDIKPLDPVFASGLQHRLRINVNDLHVQIPERCGRGPQGGEPRDVPLRLRRTPESRILLHAL